MATHIDEKGPQTLIDAISEVEKHNAAQQLMTMIILPSTVDIVLTLGAMNVMNMVISSWTVHTEYLLLELQQHITNPTKITMPAQV